MAEEYEDKQWVRQLVCSLIPQPIRPRHIVSQLSRRVSRVHKNGALLGMG